jgi:hypothetical protein
MEIVESRIVYYMTRYQVQAYPDNKDTVKRSDCQQTQTGGFRRDPSQEIVAQQSRDHRRHDVRV